MALGHVSAFTEHLGLLLRCVSFTPLGFALCNYSGYFSEISPRHEDFNQGVGWGGDVGGDAMPATLSHQPPLCHE